MNIFYLDSNAELAARYHCNKHNVKMILETAQLLSTAHRILDGELYIDSSSGRKKKRWRLEDSFMNESIYSATHINHPSAVWVRQSSHHYIWANNLLEELCKEYTYRYKKIHKIQRTGLMHVLKTIPKNIKDNGFSEPPQAMPDDCKIIGDSVTSYRNYYFNHKRNMLQWKNREVPNWLIEMADGFINIRTIIEDDEALYNEVDLLKTLEEIKMFKNGIHFNSKPMNINL